MFGIVRLIIGFAVFIGLMIVIKNKSLRRYIPCIASVVLIVVLSFLPFENLLVTFDSPEKAYEYYNNFGKSNIVLLVEGNNCDLLVDSQNDADTYLIIPKTANGWKIGMGLNTKKIVEKISDGVIVSVYRYKSTSDYFIAVFDTNGGKSNITDDYNSKFYSVERNSDFLGETFVTYYAHIPNFQSHLRYSVIVNGNEIVVEEHR